MAKRKMSISADLGVVQNVQGHRLVVFELLRLAIADLAWYWLVLRNIQLRVNEKTPKGSEVITFSAAIQRRIKSQG